MFGMSLGLVALIYLGTLRVRAMAGGRRLMPLHRNRARVTTIPLINSIIEYINHYFGSQTQT